TMKKQMAILLAAAALATGAMAQSPGVPDTPRSQGNSGWTPDMAVGNNERAAQGAEPQRRNYANERDYLRDRERERERQRVLAMQRDRDEAKARERRLRERERERERARDRARARDRDGD